MLPTPTNLVQDLRGCWSDYAEEGLPMRRRVAFCALRGGQRLAYHAGWTAGSPALRRRK